MSNETIPVIDVAPFLTGSKTDKRGVARELAAACVESGFFCITGHGIDEGLVARTRQAGDDFFALPMDRKRAILRDASRTGRGYYPVADRALAKTLGVNTPPDLQEAWVMTRENIPDDPYFRNEEAAYFFRPQHVARRHAGFPRHSRGIFRNHGRARPAHDGRDGDGA